MTLTKLPKHTRKTKLINATPGGLPAVCTGDTTGDNLSTRLTIQLAPPLACLIDDSSSTVAITPHVPTYKVIPGRSLIMSFDGGARGNPGLSGIGVSLVDEAGRPVYELAKFLGHHTNNEAEVAAATEGIQAAIALAVETLLICGDSMLTVRWLREEWAVKAPHLKKPVADAILLLKQIPHVDIEWEHRERNERADELANMGMDSQSTIEPLGTIAEALNRLQVIEAAPISPGSPPQVVSTESP